MIRTLACLVFMTCLTFSVAAATESTPRVEALVETARAEQWDPDRLFEYLDLDDDPRCRRFTNRAHLRERHARWLEAIELLDRIDPEALDAWLLGLASPPTTAVEETRRQLRCMIADLVEAAGDPDYEIRLFIDITQQFGGQFRDASQLAKAVDANSRWLDLTIDAIVRSTTRDLRTQAYIWHRKFVFSGRSFNRISESAAQLCALVAGHTWRPTNDRHRHCWNQQLSPAQREQEILTASAAPGLSRHHWGSDVDILALNPLRFLPNGRLHGDWKWLDDHGLDYGFFQTYGAVEGDDHAHMEERWHWSYYPIGQALWEFIRQNQSRVETSLFAQWDRLERRWGQSRGPYFGHMRQFWRDYLFHIQLPNVDARHSIDRFDDGQRPANPLP